MRLPITSWRNTLCALGFKVKKRYWDRIPTDTPKAEIELGIDTLEPRQMLSGSVSIIADPVTNGVVGGAGLDESSIVVYEPDFSDGNTKPTTARFTITRSSDAPETIKVDFSQSTADEVDDYNIVSTHLTSDRKEFNFLPGELTASFDVVVNNDSYADPFEEVVVKIDDGDYFIVPNQAEATAIIFEGDDEPAIVSIVAEKPAFEHGLENGSFIIERKNLGESTGAVDVHLHVIEDPNALDEATIGLDYQLKWNDGTNDIFITNTDEFTVTIPENQPAITLEIVPLTDTDIEGKESITIEIQPSASYETEIPEAVEYIYDAQGDVYVLLVKDEKGNEGDTLPFEVRLSAPSTESVTVDWALIDGTATTNQEGEVDDYTGPSDKFTGTLSFSPGEYSKTIDVDLNTDTISEEDEYFTVYLNEPVNAELSPQGERKTGTILGEEMPLRFTISDEADWEGNTLVFDWKLEGYTNESVEVVLEVLDGSATLGLDYLAPTGYTLDANNLFTLINSPTGVQGELSGTISVPTLTDAVPEIFEDFSLYLSFSNFLVDGEPYGQDARGKGYIIDAVPDLIVEDVTLKEGEVKLQKAYLTHPWFLPLTFSYDTQQVTATEGSDYLGFDGTITFLAGETEKWVPVNGLHDQVNGEPVETYDVVYAFVSPSGSSGSSGGSGNPPPPGGGSGGSGGGGFNVPGATGTVSIEDVSDETSFPVYVTATNKYGHEPETTPSSTSNDGEINLDYAGFTFSRGEKTEATGGGSGGGGGGGTSGPVDDHSTELSIVFAVTGSAVRGQDYDLVNAQGAVVSGNSVTIAAQKARTELFVKPKADADGDAYSEWDESVVITLQGVTITNPGNDDPQYRIEQGKAEAVILDADGFGRISNRNADAESTGLSRDSVGDGLVAVDLENGSVTLAMSSNGIYYTDNDNLFPMVSVEANLPRATAGQEISATLTFSKDISRTLKFEVPAPYNNERLFFALMATEEVGEKLKTGQHDFDIELKVNDKTKTIRGNTGIVNTTQVGEGDEFGQRWRHIEIDRVVLSDGTNARHVDQGLAAYGGASIVRGDNTSGFYQSDGVTATNISDPGSWTNWKDGDGYKYTKDSLTQTWTISQAPSRPFQIFASWVADFDRTNNARYAVAGAKPFGTTSETTMTVSQQYIPGELKHDNKQWRSLGWFVADGSGGAVTIQLSKENADDSVLVGGSMMYVTTQQLSQPAESFSSLEHNAGDGGFTLTNNSGETTEFNDVGYVAKRVDSNGNQVIYAYDNVDGDSESNELKTITRQGGFVTTYAYADGYLDKVTDSVGRVTDYQIVSGQLKKIKAPRPTDPSSQPITTFAYGKYNDLLTEVSQRKYGSEFVSSEVYRNAPGWTLGTLKYFEVRVEPHSADAKFKVVPLLATGEVHKAGFDEIGDQELGGDLKQARAKFDHVKGAVQSYQVDRFGLLRAESLTHDHHSSSTLDAVWKTERNDIGLITKTTTPSGGGGYDGNLAALETTYHYDENNDYNLYAIVNPDNSFTRFAYDQDNRLIRETSSIDTDNMQSIGYTRDANGNIEMITEFDFVTALSNPTDVNATVNEGNALRKTNYDFTAEPTTINSIPGGMKTSEVVGIGGSGSLDDAVETKTEYYDASAPVYLRGKTKKVTSAFGTVSEKLSQFEYDQWGNLSKTTDQAGQETVFLADVLGRVVAVTTADPDGTGEQLAAESKSFYNALGKVFRNIDPRGVSTFSEFDYVNEISTSAAFTETVSHVKDFGRQQGLQVSRVDVDTKDRKVTQIDTLIQGINSIESRNSTKEYDASGNVIKQYSETPEFATGTQHIPGGSLIAPSVAYEYDKLGNLKKVTDQLGAVTKHYYDPTKNISVTVTSKPGTGLGHPAPVEYQKRNMAGQTIQSGSSIREGYTFIDIGSLITDTETIHSGIAKTDYEYDELGRIEREYAPTATFKGANDAPVPSRTTNEYAYDLRDNQTVYSTTFWTLEGDVTNSTQFFYNDSDQVTGIVYPRLDSAIPGLVDLFAYAPTGGQSVKLSLTENTTATSLLTQVLDDAGRENALILFYQDEGRTLGDSAESTKTPIRMLATEYDNIGRTTKSTAVDPDGPGYGIAAAFTETFYDSNGNVILQKLTSQDAPGEAAKTSVDVAKFDALNRKWLQANEDNDPAPYSITNYNVDGSVQTQVYYSDFANYVVLGNPSAPIYSTSYAYDSIGRRYKTVSHGSTDIETYVFSDAGGNVIKTVDQHLVKQEYEFDALGRKTSDSESLVASKIENDAEVADSSAITVKKTFQYWADRSQKLASSDKVAASSTYDEVGNLIEQEDVKFGVTSRFEYRYDGAGNRIRSESIYREDISGNVIAGEQGQNITNFKYDDLGRLYQQIETGAFAKVRTQFEYDVFGNLIETKRIPADGSSPTSLIKNTYDYAGKLINSENNENGSESSEFEYSSIGRLIRAANHDYFGQQISEYKFKYNSVGNVSEQWVSLASLPDRDVKFSYTYDQDGRRAGKSIELVLANGSTVPVSTESFVYDELGNLEFLNQEINGYEKTIHFDLDKGRKKEFKFYESISDGDLSTRVVANSNQLFFEENEYNSDGRLKSAVSHQWSDTGSNHPKLFEKNFWVNDLGLPLSTRTQHLTSSLNDQSYVVDQVRPEYEIDLTHDVKNKGYGRELVDWDKASSVSFNDSGNVTSLVSLQAGGHFALVSNNDGTYLIGDNTRLPKDRSYRFSVTLETTVESDAALILSQLASSTVSIQGDNSVTLTASSNNVHNSFYNTFYVDIDVSTEINNARLSVTLPDGNAAVLVGRVDLYERKKQEFTWDYKGQLGSTISFYGESNHIESQVYYTYDVFGNQIVANKSSYLNNGSDPTGTATYVSGTPILINGIFGEETISVYENGARLLLFNGSNDGTNSNVPLKSVGLVDVNGDLRSIETVVESTETVNNEEVVTISRDSSIWVVRDFDGTARSWIETKFQTGTDSTTPLDRNSAIRKIGYTHTGEVYTSALNQNDESIFAHPLRAFGQFFKGFLYDDFADLSFKGGRVFNGSVGKFLTPNYGGYSSGLRDLYGATGLVPTGRAAKSGGFQYGFRYDQSLAAAGGDLKSSLWGRDGAIFDIDTPASAFFQSHLGIAHQVGQLTDIETYLIA